MAASVLISLRSSFIGLCYTNARFDIKTWRIIMENKRSKLVLIVVTVVMLLALAVGPVAPGVAAPVMDHGLPGLCPASSGGSNST